MVRSSIIMVGRVGKISDNFRGHYVSEVQIFNVYYFSMLSLFYIKHFDYGGLKHDVTGSFTLVVVKCVFTSMISGVSRTMIVYLMQWKVTFLYL